jgi:hypothetical protein
MDLGKCRSNMKQSKHLLSGFLYLMLFSLIFGIFAATAPAESTKIIYNIRLSDDVLDKPQVLMAWQMYAKFKQEWRQERFFEQFPDEKKYRYSYKEELDCRKKLAEYWRDYKKTNPKVSDEYLDDLVKVYGSIYFPEYVYKYFRSRSWEVRKDRFRMDEYKAWAKENLGRHSAKTYSHLEAIKL